MPDHTLSIGAIFSILLILAQFQAETAGCRAERRWDCPEAANLSQHSATQTDGKTFS